MYENYLTDEIRKQIHTELSKDSNLMLHMLADRIGIPEGAVVMAMGDDMCTVVAAEVFETVWSIMTGWEKVTFITMNPGTIVEVKGPLPQGHFGHGLFNIGADDSPLGGHLLTNKLAAICLVSKPFMGMESHSVRFYDKEGGLMFAVYAGRNGRSLIPSVKEGFMALRRAALQGGL
ncbi:MAG: heme utilization cystosolic carrier protein HutX [Pseudomonadota bacterium]